MGKIEAGKHEASVAEQIARMQNVGQNDKYQRIVSESARLLEISVVIPVYNEQKNLVKCLEAVYQSKYRPCEVIVVDDCSTDDSIAVAGQFPCQVVKLKENHGAAKAKNLGAAEARGDVIVTMDGDGNYPRNFIPVLLDVLDDEDIDFISCDRMGHKDRPSSFLRVSGNWVLSVAMTVLFFVRIRDSQSGMWIFKRGLLEELNLTSDEMAFSEEIKIEAFTNKKNQNHRAADLL